MIVVRTDLSGSIMVSEIVVIGLGQRNVEETEDH
jgi:hypothetical protein